jgi:hypothetical protein
MRAGPRSRGVGCGTTIVGDDDRQETLAIKRDRILATDVNEPHGVDREAFFAVPPPDRLGRAVSRPHLGLASIREQRVSEALGSQRQRGFAVSGRSRHVLFGISPKRGQSRPRYLVMRVVSVPQR